MLNTHANRIPVKGSMFPVMPPGTKRGPMVVATTCFSETLSVPVSIRDSVGRHPWTSSEPWSIDEVGACIAEGGQYLILGDHISYGFLTEIPDFVAAKFGIPREFAVRVVEGPPYDDWAGWLPDKDQVVRVAFIENTLKELSENVLRALERENPRYLFRFSLAYTDFRSG